MLRYLAQGAYAESVTVRLTIRVSDGSIASANVLMSLFTDRWRHVERAREHRLTMMRVAL
jgi:ActR/RegA family two-component response regulator